MCVLCGLIKKAQYISVYCLQTKHFLLASLAWNKERFCCCCAYTFKHRSQFPHTKPSNGGVLTKGAFQQEQGDPSKYEGQKIRDQEGSWMDKSTSSYIFFKGQ